MPKGFEPIFTVLFLFFVAYLVALWFSLVIWTFRDIQRRSQDAFVQMLATFLVLFFNFPGLLLYLLLRPAETLAEANARELEEESFLQEMAEQEVCPKCGGRVEADFLFCPMCTASLKQRCAECGRLVRPGWVACPYCGVSTVAKVPQRRQYVP